MAKTSKVTKKRVVKIEATGMAFIKASFNNGVLTVMFPKEDAKKVAEAHSIAIE